MSQPLNPDHHHDDYLVRPSRHIRRESTRTSVPPESCVLPTPAEFLSHDSHLEMYEGKRWLTAEVSLCLLDESQFQASEAMATRNSSKEKEMHDRIVCLRDGVPCAHYKERPTWFAHGFWAIHDSLATDEDGFVTVHTFENLFLQVRIPQDIQGRVLG